MFDGGGMSSTAFILSGFASIPRLLTIKLKNFPTETPKAHLADSTSCCTFSGSGMPWTDELCGARLWLISPTCHLYIPPWMTIFASGTSCSPTSGR